MSTDIESPMDVEQGVPLNEDATTTGKALQKTPSQSVFKATAEAPGTRFHPVSLAFLHISYKVQVGSGAKAKEKVILNDITGYVKPGTFVAIMGPSGSGKTSLLNVLAGRVMKAGKSKLEGQVLVNGRPRDETFKRLSAYVMQDDLLFSALTVWETVRTAALLRLPSTTSKAQKLELAEAVIQELGLSKARDTMIGNEMMRGVSGGERKRCNLAVEMLGNPSLVFLDEPTSGLDSFQALNVMSALSDLANSGRTVISTIHQPRSSIFSLFENLLLLSEGRMVYFGSAEASVDYFSRRGFNCPPHFNPADFYLDLISVDHRDPEKEQESSARIATVQDEYEPESEVRPELHQESLDEQASKELVVMEKYPSTWLTQLSVLAQRAFLQVTRDKLPLIIAYFQVIVMTVVISLLYYAGGSTSQQEVQNLTGALFFITLFLAFNGVFQMITTLPAERNIINRERSAQSYRVSAYYFSKVFTELPFRAAAIFLFAAVTYWPAQFQHNAAKYFLFIVICLAEFVSMNAVGIVIGAAAPTQQVALAFGPLATVIFMLFGGFYVNLDSIPVWLRWIRYISPIQWGFVGAAVNQFSGWTYDCPPDAVGCISNGEQVLKNLSISQYTVGEAIGYQFCVIAGMNIVAYVVLLLNGPKIQPLSAMAGPSAVASIKESKSEEKFA